MYPPPPNGLVTLLTDFGLRDPYVGLMKGMVKRHHARAEMVDLCHEVPPQSVATGAFFLAAAVDRFPAGTVHVGVVDPGVGTGRRVLAACCRSCFWVAPDNGLLTAVLADCGEERELRRVDLDAIGLRAESRTFHGRDVFAPLAGMLSSGRFGLRALGPRVDDPVRIETLEQGGDRIVLVDHFGNLVTGIAAREVRARGISAVEVSGRRVPVRRTYAEAAAGELLALVNSYDLLEIAVCRGDAAAELGVGPGTAVTVVAGGRG